MIRYGLTIFLSAFLLFQVQPMIARYILPWFGGTAAVWTTCLMFFQTVLLLGYLYAHLLRRWCSPRAAWLMHLIVLAFAASIVSVAPPAILKPTGNENVTMAIIGVLAATIGVPFFVLSSTGPLIQAWQASSHQGQSPYRLYALSNLGSMLALLTYPFLVERCLPMAQQARLWTVGFYLFSVCCCVSGWQTVQLENWLVDSNDESDPSAIPSNKPRYSQTALWFMLAMTASIILLATTNLLCQEVASIPFLWILPLSLYLLSFIICFDRPAWYRRRLFVPLLVVSVIVAIGLVHLNVFAGLLLQVAGLAAVCFAASMTCHGELERLKPGSSHLTGFYLWVAFGGAVGGIFVCVVAPLIFVRFLEFHVGLIICLVMVVGAILWPTLGRSNSVAMKAIWSKYLAVLGVFIALSIVVCSLVYFADPSYQTGLVFRGRNEYGLASVVDDGNYRRFINGRIEHGGQQTDPGDELKHISYYVPDSGVGVAFNSYRSQSDGQLDVAVIGLGAGAMTTWLEPGDKIVFYEINPMVEFIANEFFTFLEDSPAEVTVKLGDGRMQLQAEAINPNSPQYDLIFIDAFSSDSIPVHLLTSECFELYLDRLKPEGVIVAHITNRFIDLLPVIRQHADQFGLTPILIDYQSEDSKVETRTVLMTRNEAVVRSQAVRAAQRNWPEEITPVRWTDDYASVAALLDWSASIDWNKIGLHLRDSQKTQRPANNAQ